MVTRCKDYTLVDHPGSAAPEFVKVSTLGTAPNKNSSGGIQINHHGNRLADEGVVSELGGSVVLGGREAGEGLRRLRHHCYELLGDHEDGILHDVLRSGMPPRELVNALCIERARQCTTKPKKPGDRPTRAWPSGQGKKGKRGKGTEKASAGTQTAAVMAPGRPESAGTDSKGRSKDRANKKNRRREPTGGAAPAEGYSPFAVPGNG